MAKLLRPVHPNAGVRIAYQKRLDALIAEMQRSVVWWGRAAYRKDEARIVPDFAQEAPAHAHPDVSCFHTWRKTVQTTDGPREVIVDVMEKRGETPSHVVYNLTREGSKNYEDRKKKTPTADSGPFLRAFGAQDSDAVVENNIGSFFEVVNLRFADEGTGRWIKEFQ